MKSNNACPFPALLRQINARPDTRSSLRTIERTKENVPCRQEAKCKKGGKKASAKNDKWLENILKKDPRIIS